MSNPKLRKGIYDGIKSLKAAPSQQTMIEKEYISMYEALEALKAELKELRDFIDDERLGNHFDSYKEKNEIL